VGDPLYRPFSKSPAQLQADLLKRKSPLLEWSVLRLVNLDRKHGAPLGALAASLEQLSVTSRSAVLTEKLADLTEALGKPASAIDYYQRALTLNPSAQQRVRLRLTLGTELTAEHRPAEAAEDYRQLLREVPDYPAKDDLTKTLEQLEPKPAKP
jgi:tetratricopeptide (TPR) repeat protein